MSEPAPPSALRLPSVASFGSLAVDAHHPSTPDSDVANAADDDRLAKMASACRTLIEVRHGNAKVSDDARTAAAFAVFG